MLLEFLAYGVTAVVLLAGGVVLGRNSTKANVYTDYLIDQVKKLEAKLDEHGISRD